MSTRELNCREALRLLAEYLDHELDDLERARVERHLEKCRDCYSRAEFERRLKQQIAALGRAPVDDDFERRIRDLIRTFESGTASGA